MKLHKLLIACLLVLGFQVSQAVAATPTTGLEPILAEDFYTPSDADIAVPVMEKHKKKKGLGKAWQWIKSKVNKAVSALKDLGGLDDPVDKWFWFWIIGWGAAILLSIIAAAVAVGGAFTGGFGIAAILALLGWLAGLFGTVALIVWLVKKFG